MLYHPEALFELVKTLGNPLWVNTATASFTRLERARVLVEVEVTKVIPEAILIEFKGQNLKIKV